MWEASRIVLDRYSIIPRAQARGIDFSFPDWKEMALLELFLAFPGGDFRIKNIEAACCNGILRLYMAFLRDYWDYFVAKLSLFISMERGEGACYPCHPLRLCSAGRAAPRHDVRG